MYKRQEESGGKGMQEKEVTEVVLDAGDALTAKEALLQVWCGMVFFVWYAMR